MTLNASDDANVIITALFQIPDVTEWECSERAAGVGQIAWHASLCLQTREEEEKEKRKKSVDVKNRVAVACVHLFARALASST